MHYIGVTTQIKVDQKTFQRLLKKYQEGTATDAERYVVDTWYAHLGQPPVAIPNIQTAEQKEALKARLWAGMSTHRPRKIRYQRTWLRIAAGIALVMGISVLLYVVNVAYPTRDGQRSASPTFLSTITTGSKQLKRIVLPDSTLVWLNANSTLQVASNYGNPTRLLSLTGEAFFEVKRDTLAPFKVLTDGITVNVLGTSFNIQSYADLSNIKVSVATGKVLVADTAGKPLSELRIGQQLSYDKELQTSTIHRLESTGYEAWRKGNAVLDKADFAELSRHFFNLYGVQLKTMDNRVITSRFNLTMQAAHSAEKTATMLCKILNKDFRKEANGDFVIY
ncbi:FecR family protein [Parapedobacter koreensis]|uniref:FecR family protein n=1 Tax=Parapedobacter koreensis TaxID=332977 RepID=A0A1H7FWL6_9SPHI|nr:FecR family protein [Parapedobacter koreensis]